MSDRLDVAIVGCGRIAGAHAAALRSRSDARLVAGIDPSQTARLHAAEEWGCAVFVTLEEALEERSLDVAVVCTPPGTHADVASALLEAGIHVLCEKPLATRSADARRMVEAARLHDRVLDVSAKFRHVPDLGEAARRIDAGEIGRPVYYEVTFCAPVDVEDSWSVDPSLSGGGVVMDNGPHALDVLSHVLDAPIARVSAGFSRPVGSGDVEDTAEIQFQTEEGTIGRIGLSWTYFTKDLDYLMVQGTEGGVRVGWTGGKIRRHGEQEWTSFGDGYDKAEAFSRQLDAFLRRVRGERRSGGEAGWEAVDILAQIYAAEEAGSWKGTTRSDEPANTAGLRQAGAVG